MFVAYADTNGEVWLFTIALRDIAAGQEICVDYGMNGSTGYMDALCNHMQHQQIGRQSVLQLVQPHLEHMQAALSGLHGSAIAKRKLSELAGLGEKLGDLQELLALMASASVPQTASHHSSAPTTSVSPSTIVSSTASNTLGRGDTAQTSSPFPTTPAKEGRLSESRTLDSKDTSSSASSARQGTGVVRRLPFSSGNDSNHSISSSCGGSGTPASNSVSCTLGPDDTASQPSSTTTGGQSDAQFWAKSGWRQVARVQHSPSPNGDGNSNASSIRTSIGRPASSTSSNSSSGSRTLGDSDTESGLSSSTTSGELSGNASSTGSHGSSRCS